jgi:hypothetical protein
MLNIHVEKLTTKVRQPRAIILESATNYPSSILSNETSHSIKAQDTNRN